MLDRIPAEIYGLILDQVHGHNELTNLCLVSKTLYELTLPKLYEHVVLMSECCKHRERIDVEPYFRGGAFKHLHHAKYIRFLPPFYCDSHEESKESSIHSGDDSTEANESEKPTRSVMELLKNLRTEGLTSFNWDLGIRIPDEILGSNGYLPQKQSSLETIVLATEPRSARILHGSIIDLSRFNALRRVTWINVHTFTHFQTLRHALKRNSQTLTRLQLSDVKEPMRAVEDSDLEIADDFTGYDSDDDLDNGSDYETDNEIDEASDTDSEEGQAGFYRNLLAHECLGLKPSTESKKGILPALTFLSLNFLSLKRAEKALVQAFNIWALSGLELQYCAGVDKFLKKIIGSGQNLKLSSLRLTCGNEIDKSCIKAILLEMIRMSPELTDLFLAIPGPECTMEIWRTLAEVKPPLTTFIYHQRSFEPDMDDSDVQEDWDSLGLTEGDIDELAKAGDQHLLNVFKFEFLGLGIHPSLLKRILAPPCATKSLKMLHIRHTSMPTAGNIKTLSEDVLWTIFGMEENLRNGGEPRVSRPSAGSAVVSNDSSTDDGTDWDIVKKSFESVPRDFIEFAMWVFGPYGIQSLQVLAYGDFSWGSRSASHTHLLCRGSYTIRKPKGSSLKDGEIPFRQLASTDTEPWNLFLNNFEFLMACPVNH